MECQVLKLSDKLLFLSNEDLQTLLALLIFMLLLVSDMKFRICERKSEHLLVLMTTSRNSYISSNVF